MKIGKLEFYQGFLEIIWKSGEESKISYRNLRLICPCAVCIDEFTGKKLIDESLIPTDIVPLESCYIGNYAIKIKWSDNHDTGIYSFKSLYEYLKKTPIKS